MVRQSWSTTCQHRGASLGMGLGIHITRLSAAQALVPDIPPIGWSDVGGHAGVKRALRELIEVSRQALAGFTLQQFLEPTF